MSTLKLFFIIWSTFAAITFMVGPLISDEWDLPTDQKVAAMLLIGLVAPLTVTVLLCVGLYKGVPWLARGFTGLYRTYFPAEVKLPEARIRERK